MQANTHEHMNTKQLYNMRSTAAPKAKLMLATIDTNPPTHETNPEIRPGVTAGPEIMCLSLPRHTNVIRRMRKKDTEQSYGQLSGRHLMTPMSVTLEVQ